jgi:ABC-type dipeptide/oligopeptide/nickel transport system permease subunit
MSTTVNAAPPAPPTILGAIGRGIRALFRRAPLSAFWGVIAALIVTMAVAAPLIAPYPPLKSDFRAMQKPPSEAHWFGTDQIGRDTLSRVMYGAQSSLTVALGAVLFGTTVGALWGLACGYFGGRFDMISQRLIEFLQSFPDLILAMAIAMALGGGLGTVIVATPCLIASTAMSMLPRAVIRRTGRCGFPALSSRSSSSPEISGMTTSLITISGSVRSTSSLASRASAACRTSKPQL